MTTQQLLRQNGPEPPAESANGSGARRCVYSVRLDRSIHALNRVLNTFSARNFPLDSFSLGSAEGSSWQLTLVCTEAPRKLTQLQRRLEGLVDVLEVEVLCTDEAVERELCLLLVTCHEDRRRDILGCVEVFQGEVLEMTPSRALVQVTSTTPKIESFIALMRPFGLQRVVRSGSVGLSTARIHPQMSSRA